MRPGIVACDVDDVLLALRTEWIRRYNFDYNDNLQLGHDVEWDMHKLVRPECGKKIYDYLHQPDLYSMIQVVDFAQEAIAEIRAMGHRVVFVSSCTRHMADQKWECLEKYGFLPHTNMQHDDLIFCHDKSLIHADVLIDDKAENFRGWRTRGILFNKPYNANKIIPPTVTRAYNWPEILLILHGDL